MHKLVSLTYLNFKEGLRERVFIGVVFLFFFLLSLCLFLGRLSLGEYSRILTNAGLSGIEICGLIIAMFSLVNSFYRESHSKMLDISLVYTSRPNIILAKFFGFSLIIALFLFASFSGLGIILAFYKGFSFSLLWGFYYLFLKLLLVIGFTLVFCVALRTMFISLFASISLFLTSELLPSALEFAQANYIDIRTKILLFLYRLLPNMDKLDVKPLVTYGLKPESYFVISTSFYAFIYLGALLTLASYIFTRKEY